MLEDNLMISIMVYNFLEKYNLVKLSKKKQKNCKICLNQI